MSLKRRVYVQPVPKLPSGLVDLMDGLARDVLKHNPENIYEFCAQHMHTLLELRDGHSLKSPITLDQKIARAQKKVKERAEQRRRTYDDSVRSIPNYIPNKIEVLTQCDVVVNFKPSNKIEETDIEQDKEQKEKKLPNEIVLELKDYAYNGSLEEVKDSKEKVVTPENKTSDQEYLQCNISREQSEAAMRQADSTAVNNDITKQETKQSEVNIILNENLSLIVEANEKSMDEDKVNEAIVLDVVLNKSAAIIETEIKEATKDNSATENFENNQSLKSSADQTLSKNGVHGDIEIENQVAPGEKTDSSYNVIDNPTASVIITALVNTPKGAENNDDLVKNNIDIEIKQDTSDQNANNKQLNNKIGTDKNREDDKIFAVILSGSIGHDLNQSQTGQNKEHYFAVSDPISNNENDKLKKLPDLESATDSGNDKTRTINTSMDLETAAITIQKVFRSFLFKTKTASYDDPTTVDMNLLVEVKDKEENDTLNNPIKDRRHLGISRMDTVLQTVNEEKSLSLSTDDSSTLSSAATIIQAHVRGFLVRNKLNLSKTTSTNSLIDSDAPSIPSLEADSENRKSKTVLNIHIVPEGGHFVSRDESIITSMDLSLDSSPPSSVNLHPLGYDKSERRKQLKREDAIQSVSPPSNNSGKLSDELDSVKEVLVTDNNTVPEMLTPDRKNKDNDPNNVDKLEDNVTNKEQPGLDVASDEMDVITPFVSAEDKGSRESDNSTKLLHSGEFHDILVPTEVTRSDTSVVRGGTSSESEEDDPDSDSEGGDLISGVEELDSD